MEDATASSSTHVVTQPPLKQARIDSGLSMSQQRVNKLVLNFLVDDVQCFSLVEQPSFRKLIEGISGGKKVMCRKTLMQRIDREFAVMKESVISKLINVDTVCTTADIWSAQNRSFFGVTCHWIDKDTLERHSAALACTRLNGRHTYDAVAAKLKIHAEYRIQNKVKSTVTDIGSNFVKAFREFGVRDDESDDYSDEVEEDGDGEQFFLPQHQRCAAHTLNLIATNEIHKAASNGPSFKLYRSAMAKCSSIWNKAHRSSLATEVVQEIANVHLTVPSVTRWNSEFRAITKLAGLPEEKLREICDKLDVPRLYPQESAFLYNSHIVTAISEAIEERFGSVLASHEAKMATASLPKFCLNWLSPEKRDDM
ncbi:hypothetical protein M9458_000550, partial [Cirrhinus mrigala]